jgi:hypothetical protein
VSSWLRIGVEPGRAEIRGRRPESVGSSLGRFVRGPAVTCSPSSDHGLGCVQDFHVFLSSYQSLSDCEDDPAEGAALNKVTHSFRRFCQWEALCHDRLDRAGLKERNYDIPSFSHCLLRLRK